MMHQLARLMLLVLVRVLMWVLLLVLVRRVAHIGGLLSWSLAACYVLRVVHDKASLCAQCCSSREGVQGYMQRGCRYKKVYQEDLSRYQKNMKMMSSRSLKKRKDIKKVL